MPIRPRPVTPLRIPWKILHLHHLTASSGSDSAWRSSGNDPHLIIQGFLQPGRFIVRWSGSSEQSRELTLSLDYGTGFQKSEMHVLGTLVGQLQIYEIALTASAKVRAIRFDFGEQPGNFIWELLGIEEIVGCQPIPVHEIESLGESSGFWRSLGVDPHFHLVGALPTGPTRIRWSGSCNITRKLKLYVDSGAGFNERDTCIIGKLDAQGMPGDAIVRLPESVFALRLDPGDAPGDFCFRIESISNGQTTSRFPPLRLWPSLVRRFVRHPDKLRVLRRLRSGGLRSIWRTSAAILGGSELHLGGSYRPEPAADVMARAEILHQDMATWPGHPVISLLVPVYNPRPEHLAACIASVRQQVYPHWELCLADDASTDPAVRRTLMAAQASDARIKVAFRPTNGHIAACTNSALDLATGPFVALLDNDDILSPDALFEVARAAVEQNADWIYSDEDKITDAGVRFDPFFKPDWSPELLLGLMYTGHLSAYRTSLVRQLNGFRTGLDGSQDFDLALRMAEITNRIHHVSKVLYHWRVHAASTSQGGDVKPYTQTAARRAVTEALERRGIVGTVHDIPRASSVFRVSYRSDRQPLVSIIIPTRDAAELMRTCIDSLCSNTDYPHYEIIVVDNGSIEPETRDLFAALTRRLGERFRTVHCDFPFNFSRLMNAGVAVARGDMVLLLNNDITVITPGWLGEMVGYAERPEIGAVGATLLYSDDTLQHAGVIIGIGGVAGHSHKHAPAEDPGYFYRLKVVGNYSAVTGACLLVRRQAYLDVGGFEERLAVAFNDVDFCLRLRRSGLRNVLLPQARLYHHESKTRGYEDTPEKVQRFKREIARMQEIWGPTLEHDPYYSPHLTLEREDFSFA